MKPTRSLVLACLALAACATSSATQRRSHELEVKLAALRREQGVFREQNTGTHVFDFEGHGRVTVREITLDGFPGRTYLRCRFHYQNRTAKPVVQAWVSLDVLNAAGQVVSTQSCHCIVPVPIPIERGSYYSDELRTPTYDAHLQPGWSWRIRCVADLQTEEEPLNPPAPDRWVRQVAPMQIKDRNWPYPNTGWR
jgi:hypothetical protein